MKRPVEVLCEDKQNGVISVEKFMELSSRCEAEQKEQENRLEELLSKQRKMKDGNKKIENFIDELKICMNKPTIGVAKSFFHVDNQTDIIMPDSSAGRFTDIVINREVYGRTLRTHCNVKPVFVSVGNYICLDTACKIALELTGKESHIPIPTRLADLETHIMRRMILDEQL